MSDRGVLTSLFDLSFSHFVTPKIQKFLYVLLLIGAGVAAFSVLGAAIGMGSGFFGKTGGLLIGIPAAILVFLALAMYIRVIMEMLIIAFRAVEYLGEISATLKRNASGTV
ncbi:MAG: DUF4282 domain-containing protein [Gemmatimonadales bacterium]